MDSMETGILALTTNDGRQATLHAAGVVDDLITAGWRLGMGRENWFKRTVIGAEGGGLEETRKRLARELGLRRSPALDRAADMLTAFAVEAYPLRDSDIGGIKALIAGLGFKRGAVAAEVD